MSADFLRTRAAQLEKNGPLPLYYQIKQHLKQAIDTAHLVPGQALPSERVLVEWYGVASAARPCGRLPGNYFTKVIFTGVGG